MTTNINQNEQPNIDIILNGWCRQNLGIGLRDFVGFDSSNYESLDEAKEELQRLFNKFRWRWFLIENNETNEQLRLPIDKLMVTVGGQQQLNDLLNHKKSSSWTLINYFRATDNANLGKL